MSSEKGQTILEVVVVVAVVIMVTGALVFATVFSLRSANFAKQQSQATKLAQEGLEKIRTDRDRDGALLSSNIPNVDSWGDSELWIRIAPYCPAVCYFKIVSAGGITGLGSGGATIPASAEDINNGQFKRVVILDDEGDGTIAKRVTVVVTWKDATGDHESRLSTVLRRL